MEKKAKIPIATVKGSEELQQAVISQIPVYGSASGVCEEALKRMFYPEQETVNEIVNPSLEEIIERNQPVSIKVTTDDLFYFTELANRMGLNVEILIGQLVCQYVAGSVKLKKTVSPVIEPITESLLPDYNKITDSNQEFSNGNLFVNSEFTEFDTLENPEIGSSKTTETTENRSSETVIEKLEIQYSDIEIEEVKMYLRGYGFDETRYLVPSRERQINETFRKLLDSKIAEKDQEIGQLRKNGELLNDFQEFRNCTILVIENFASYSNGYLTHLFKESKESIIKACFPEKLHGLLQQ